MYKSSCNATLPLSLSLYIIIFFIFKSHTFSMMLNSEAPPFEYPPHPTYYFYQPTCYFYYPPPHFNNNDLALQFSHLSLTEVMMEQEPPPPPPLPANNTSTQRVFVDPLPLHDLSQQNMRGKRVSKAPMEFDEAKLGVEIRTTVMIKNIPNRLSRDMLITLLDQHCAEENYKAVMEGSPLSEYDFIYLPMDFLNECNLGYAFVNFTTPVAGWRLYRSMHRRKWAIFSSNKTSHICYARIQGKEALVDNFRRSCFVCQDDKYLPAVLSPPRNGTTSLTRPSAVGKRICFGR